MILMVDDDQDTLEIYRMMLAKSEYAHRFDVISSPLVALAWLQDRVISFSAFPRYIFIDLRMSELTGFEFIERFEKSIPYHKLNTEVIVLTNSVRQCDQQQTMRYPSVSQFISKPLAQTQLLDFLAKATGAGSSSTDLGNMAV